MILRSTKKLPSAIVDKPSKVILTIKLFITLASMSVTRHDADFPEKPRKSGILAVTDMFARAIPLFGDK